MALSCFIHRMSMVLRCIKGDPILETQCRCLAYGSKPRDPRSNAFRTSLSCRSFLAVVWT